MCRAHGLPGRFDADAWVNPRRTPPYYPDAVTLDRAAVATSILERIDTTTPHCSIKDSFATLDLTPFGFRIVGEAEWIYREARSYPGASLSGMRWMAIETAGQLVEWESAWDADGAQAHLFRPALLENPLVAVVAGYVDGSIVAGAIANRTEDVVGLSNVFTRDGDLEGAWIGILSYMDTAMPGLAIVGYETGDALATTRRQGFLPLGALRIWLGGEKPLNFAAIKS
jgi:hypothetical protein